MKLYATTTSERASKGQGGNEFLNTVITSEEGQKLVTVEIKKVGDITKDLLQEYRIVVKYLNFIALERSHWVKEELKGKKLKTAKKERGAEYPLFPILSRDDKRRL